MKLSKIAEQTIYEVKMCWKKNLIFYGVLRTHWNENLFLLWENINLKIISWKLNFCFALNYFMRKSIMTKLWFLHYHVEGQKKLRTWLFNTSSLPIFKFLNLKKKEDLITVKSQLTRVYNRYIKILLKRI